MTCRYWFCRDHVNDLQWRFTKSTKLSTIRHSQLPKVRLASHSQQSFLHKVSSSFCAIFAVFSDSSSHREKFKKCPQKMSTVPRSPGRGLENLRLRDRKIKDSRSSPLQEMSRCWKVSLFVEKFLYFMECQWDEWLNEKDTFQDCDDWSAQASRDSDGSAITEQSLVLKVTRSWKWWTRTSSVYQFKSTIDRLFGVFQQNMCTYTYQSQRIFLFFANLFLFHLNFN